MAAVSTDDLRELIDRLEAKEKDADTQAERDALLKRIDDLEAKIAARDGGTEPEPEPEPEDEPEPEGEPEPEPEGEKKPPKARTRPGRKRGQLYQDGPGGLGYVFQGDDEPDTVEIESDDD